MLRLKTIISSNIFDEECTAKKVPWVDEEANKFLYSIILIDYSEWNFTAQKWLKDSFIENYNKRV